MTTGIPRASSRDTFCATASAVEKSTATSAIGQDSSRLDEAPHAAAPNEEQSASLHQRPFAEAAGASLTKNSS